VRKEKIPRLFWDKMRCKICKTKITKEEEGISEVIKLEMCVSCLHRFRVIRSFLRTSEEKE